MSCFGEIKAEKLVFKMENSKEYCYVALKALSWKLC